MQLIYCMYSIILTSPVIQMMVFVRLHPLSFFSRLLREWSSCHHLSTLRCVWHCVHDWCNQIVPWMSNNLILYKYIRKKKLLFFFFLFFKSLLWFPFIHADFFFPIWKILLGRKVIRNLGTVIRIFFWAYLDFIFYHNGYDMKNIYFLS